MSPPTNSVEFTTGKRGNDNFINDGQRYTLNRRRHGKDGVEKSYWICTVSGCKARFVLHDQRVKNSPLQNHGDQQAELTVHIAKVQLKSRAATCDMSTKRIVAKTVSGLDFESRAKLGCQLNCCLELLPTDNCLILHPWRTSYLLTPNGDQLLLWDSGFTTSLRRSYLFGTCANLDVLGS